jgi:hypothetical protein
VVFADDLVSFDVAHAEWDTAVKADVSGRRQGAIGETVNHHPFIEQTRGVGLGSDRMREGDWVPERSQRMPVRLGEGTSPGKAGSAGRNQLSVWNEGCSVRHASL